MFSIARIRIRKWDLFRFKKKLKIFCISQVITSLSLCWPIFARFIVIFDIAFGRFSSVSDGKLTITSFKKAFNLYPLKGTNFQFFQFKLIWKSYASHELVEILEFSSLWREIDAQTKTYKTNGSKTEISLLLFSIKYHVSFSTIFNGEMRLALQLD